MPSRCAGVSIHGIALDFAIICTFEAAPMRGIEPAKPVEAATSESCDRRREGRTDDEGAGQH